MGRPCNLAVAAPDVSHWLVHTWGQTSNRNATPVLPESLIPRYADRAPLSGTHISCTVNI